MEPHEVVASALAAPYTRIFHREDDGGYSAFVLELPGVFAGGSTIALADEELDAAMGDWVAAELDAGRDIPLPLDIDDFSGRITFRIPPSLHQRAYVRAQLEGVSLNRLLSDAVSEYLGGTRRLAEPIDPAAGGRTVRIIRVAEPARRPRGGSEQPT